jgi:uncharacterized protein
LAESCSTWTRTLQQPSLLDVAQAIDPVKGVKAFNISVSEIDLETVGTDITVEGDEIDYRGLMKAIEGTGAMVHSIDELVVGEYMVERIKRVR